MKATKIEFDVHNSKVWEFKDLLTDIPDDWEIKVLIRWGGLVKKIIATPPSYSAED